MKKNSKMPAVLFQQPDNLEFAEEPPTPMKEIWEELLKEVVGGRKTTSPFRTR